MSTSIKTHISCSKCGSSDGATLYSDGHIHCFSCGSNIYNNNVGNISQKKQLDIVKTYPFIKSIRNINIETLKLFGYEGYINNDGEKVQVAPYFSDDGKLVAQKCRLGSGSDKTLWFNGKQNKATIFGKKVADGLGRKRIYITEGEIDCMSLSQVLDNKWGVVSVPNGAESMKTMIEHNFHWLSEFEEIILGCDSDEVGQKAHNIAFDYLEPSKLKIIKWKGAKDCNELLQANKIDDIKSSIYGASVFHMQNMFYDDELLTSILTEPDIASYKYPFSGLQEASQGFSDGEVIMLGAGSGIGKSSFIRQLAYSQLNKGINVGYINLEGSKEDCVLNIISKKLETNIYHQNLKCHDKNLVTSAFNDIIRNKFTICESINQNNYLTEFRYLAKVKGCKIIIFDNITKFSAMVNADNMWRFLESFVSIVHKTAKELKVAIFLIIHLTRPEGKIQHEQGAIATPSQCKGSQSFDLFNDQFITLERNKDHPKYPNHVIVRLWKGRSTRTKYTGLVQVLQYNVDSTLYKEDNNFNKNSLIYKEKEDKSYNKQNSY